MHKKYTISMYGCQYKFKFTTQEIYLILIQCKWLIFVYRFKKCKKKMKKIKENSKVCYYVVFLIFEILLERQTFFITTISSKPIKSDTIQVPLHLLLNGIFWKGKNHS